MELASGVAEQPRQVSETSHIPQSYRSAVEGDRPVIALAPDNVLSICARTSCHCGTRIRRRRWPGSIPGRAADRVGCARRLSRGADTFECRLSRSKLAEGARLVPDGATGVRKPHSSERRLVRRADVAPSPDGLFEIAARSGRVRLGKSDLSAREHGAGGERFARENGGDARELVGRRSRPIDVPAGNLDLDLCFEQRGAAEIGIGRQFLRRNVRGVVERVPDQRRGRPHVALGEAHLRETRLRIPPGLAGGHERFFRARQYPPFAGGFARARPAASRIRDEDTGAAPRRPQALPAPPQRSDPRSRRISARWTRQRP